MSQTFSLQKSRELLKEQNFDTWIVEKPFNQWTKRREDLFNFADLVGIREDVQGVTAVQACGEDASAHTRKLLEGYTDSNGKTYGPNPHLPIWLRGGNKFFLWAWRLRGAKGKRKTYDMKEYEFVLKDGIVICQETKREEA